IHQFRPPLSRDAQFRSWLPVRLRNERSDGAVFRELGRRVAVLSLQSADKLDCRGEARTKRSNLALSATDRPVFPRESDERLFLHFCSLSWVGASNQALDSRQGRDGLASRRRARGSEFDFSWAGFHIFRWRNRPFPIRNLAIMTPCRIRLKCNSRIWQRLLVR